MEMPQAHPRCRLSFRGFHSPGQKLGDLQGLAKKNGVQSKDIAHVQHESYFFNRDKKNADNMLQQFRINLTGSVMIVHDFPWVLPGSS
jgi:hypothetical protein